MMDLTPLEVRKKKDDFRRQIRGYEPGQVDDFLDLVADRLEQLVKENRTLAESSGKLEQQVGEYREREKALTEALVSAQQMREEMRAQATRDADQARSQAASDAERARTEANAVLARAKEEAAKETSQAAAEAQRRLAHAADQAERELAEARATAERELAEARATAEAEAREIVGNAREQREREERLLQDLTVRRAGLLESYQSLLEREMADLRSARQSAGEAGRPKSTPGNEAAGEKPAHDPPSAPEAFAAAEPDAMLSGEISAEEDRAVLLLEDAPVGTELLVVDGPEASADEVQLLEEEVEEDVALPEEESSVATVPPAMAASTSDVPGPDIADPVSDEEWLESLLEEVGVEPVMGGAAPPAAGSSAPMSDGGARAARDELGLEEEDLPAVFQEDAVEPQAAELEADLALEEGSAEFAELILGEDEVEIGPAGDPPADAEKVEAAAAETGSAELAALLEAADAELRAAEAAAGLADLDAHAGQADGEEVAGADRRAASGNEQTHDDAGADDDDLGLDAMFSDEDDDLKAFDFDAALVNATGMPAAPANTDPLSFTSLPGDDSRRGPPQSFGFGVVADEIANARDAGVLGTNLRPRIPPVPSGLSKAQEEEGGEAATSERARPEDDDDMFANLFDGRR